MKTYTTLSYTSASPTVVALGCFDGIHVGHRAVIGQAREIAERLGLPLTVWTFEEPPKNHFIPHSVPLITDKREKREQMRRLGVDHFICVPFSDTICRMSAELFFVSILQERLKAAHLVCGFDYSFGAKGQGNVSLLQALCEATDVGLTVVPPVTVGEHAVSSSAIRQAIEEGNTQRATGLLGRPYSLRTAVIDGQKLARRLGFPTLNQEFPKGALVPRHGVYATRITIQGRKKRFYGITNVGIRPTVGGTALCAETHIFDFDGDLYGKWVRIEFLAFVRDETKFHDLDALTAQVRTDMETVRKIIALQKDIC